MLQQSCLLLGAIKVIEFDADTRRAVVAVQGKFAAGSAASVLQPRTVFTQRRRLWAIAVVATFTYRIQVSLLVQKSSVTAASHTKMYANVTKFVKMLERLKKMYYTVFITGGN